MMGIEHHRRAYRLIRKPSSPTASGLLHDFFPTIGGYQDNDRTRDSLESDLIRCEALMPSIPGIFQSMMTRSNGCR